MVCRRLFVYTLFPGVDKGYSGRDFVCTPYTLHSECTVHTDHIPKFPNMLTVFFLLHANLQPVPPLASTSAALIPHSGGCQPCRPHMHAIPHHHIEGGAWAYRCVCVCVSPIVHILIKGAS